jgi:hypothetical protein
MSFESDGGMILTGENRRTRRKTCPSATLSTTNPTWIGPGHDDYWNTTICGVFWIGVLKNNPFGRWFRHPIATPADGSPPQTIPLAAAGKTAPLWLWCLQLTRTYRLVAAAWGRAHVEVTRRVYRCSPIPSRVWPALCRGQYRPHGEREMSRCAMTHLVNRTVWRFHSDAVLWRW